MEDQQAITTFQQAAEQLRYFRGHEWLITFYALTAYGALASAPKLLEQYRVWWRIFLSVTAIVLVVLVAWQAWRTLWYSVAQEGLERARLNEAITHLPLIEQIYRDNPPLERSERPSGVRRVQQLFAQFSEKNELPAGRWGLAFAVALGALFASQFLISQIVVSIQRGQAFGLFGPIRRLWLGVIGLEVALALVLATLFFVTFGQTEWAPAGNIGPLPPPPMPDPLL